MLLAQISTEVMVAIIAVLGTLAGALVYFNRRLVNRFEREMEWLTSYVEKKDGESKEDRNEFMSVTRQFQVVLGEQLQSWMMRIDQWEKNREEVLGTNNMFHKEQIALMQNLSAEAIEAIALSKSRDENTKKLEEHVDSIDHEHKEIMGMMAKACDKLARICEEFEIKNGNNVRAG